LLRDLQDRLDIRTVNWHAANPAVLEGGCADANLLVRAHQQRRSENMVACHVAWTLFKTPTRSPASARRLRRRPPELFSEGAASPSMCG